MATALTSTLIKGRTIAPLPRTLHLLSFNIQLGINTKSYRHYVTKAWQHILPHSKRQENLRHIANILQKYDVVALQEVDGGSLRSGFVNQIEHLALCSHIPYWYQQLNRNMGKIAQHSNGILTRFIPDKIVSHALPGLRGRGAIEMQFKQENLIIIGMHLALGWRTQAMQLEYIRKLVQGWQHMVLMGDMNTNENKLLHYSPLKALHLKSAIPNAQTFPSWKPSKGLDHVLLSQEIAINEVTIPNIQLSDHLPVGVEIQLPLHKTSQ